MIVKAAVSDADLGRAQACRRQENTHKEEHRGWVRLEVIRLAVDLLGRWFAVGLAAGAGHGRCKNRREIGSRIRMRIRDEKMRNKERLGKIEV